jgi:hypothetical protein
MDTAKSERKKAFEKCVYTSRVIKESLNNLETQVKSELALMHRINLIQINSNLFKTGLDSITKNNKAIHKLRDFLK